MDYELNLWLLSRQKINQTPLLIVHYVNTLFYVSLCQFKSNNVLSHVRHYHCQTQLILYYYRQCWWLYNAWQTALISTTSSESRRLSSRLEDLGGWDHHREKKRHNFADRTELAYSYTPWAIVHIDNAEQPNTAGDTG